MRALVTGGSRGIGAGICKKLTEDALRRGEVAQIAICGLTDSNELKESVSVVKGLGGEALALFGDVGRVEVPSKLVERAADVFGGLDAVVANAGIANPSSLAEVELEDWERMFNVNLRGPWLLAKAAFPHLSKSKGCLVTVSSMSGRTPHAGSGAYSPAKAALTMLSKTLAIEWAPDGVRVNTVSPGMTWTTMSEAMYKDPKILKSREQLIPLGRIGLPEDIANAVAYFCGPESSYVTGEDICVDGGFSSTILSHIPGRPKSR